MKKTIETLVKRIAKEASSEDILRMAQAVGILTQVQQTRVQIKQVTRCTHQQ